MDQAAQIDLTMGFAEPGEAQAIAAVLAEGAAWMAAKGWPGWTPDDVSAAFVAARIASGEMVAARAKDGLAGVCTLSRADPDFWPDDRPGDAAYLHRLAVRRVFADRKVTPAIVAWCAQTARSWGCRALKLDCHPNIRDVYLRLGFTHVDQRTVSPSDRAPYTVDRFVRSL